MSQTVTFNGQSYIIPDTGDESWGTNLTNYFVAIPNGALQKTGGTFTLTANVNFGANFGLLSKFFSTRTANPSSVGLVRLAKTDSIGWRNNANGADLLLAINGSDQLTFNGVLVDTHASQTANTVFAGPTSGGAALPAFRALVTADLPAGITVRATGAITIFSTSATIIINGTETYDATNIYDNTTGRATIAVAGKYRIGGYIESILHDNPSEYLKLMAYKNGSLYSTIGLVSLAINSGPANDIRVGVDGSDTIDCAINDVIDLRVLALSGSWILTGNCYITIEKVG